MTEPLILHIPALSAFPLELWIRGTRLDFQDEQDPPDRRAARALEQQFSAELRAEVGDRLLSVTHSQGVTVVLAGEPPRGAAGGAWGIDIEFSERQISERAQARFWSESERLLAPELSPLMAWTLKESALKARGQSRPSQPITQWRVSQCLPQGIYLLSDGELTARGAILPESAHGIVRAILAVAFLETPGDAI